MVLQSGQRRKANNKPTPKDDDVILRAATQSLTLVTAQEEQYATQQDSAEREGNAGHDDEEEDFPGATALMKTIKQSAQATDDSLHMLLQLESISVKTEAGAVVLSPSELHAVRGFVVALNNSLDGTVTAEEDTGLAAAQAHLQAVFDIPVLEEDHDKAKQMWQEPAWHPEECSLDLFQQRDVPSDNEDLMAREGIKQQREPSIGEEELDATRKEMETAREASKLDKHLVRIEYMATPDDDEPRAVDANPPPKKRRNKKKGSKKTEDKKKKGKVV